MKVILVAILSRIVLIVFFCLSYRCVSAQGIEEFNGPFSTWANIKTRFGAGRNKTGDDTRAIQVAIDSLSVFLSKPFNTGPSTKYVVLYLPAGTYRISSTLRLTGKIGCTIIGEDPERTVIQWNGADNDTMFVANGSSYFKVSRLTWDAGKGRNIEMVGLHWLDKNGLRFAPTSVEFSDMIFKNGTYGIFGGTYGNHGTGANDAEVTIKRCRFYHCSESGIAIKGYNALDYWIWNCSFYDCGRAVQCHLGNYHIYQCLFYRSAITDLDNSDGYYCSVRGCYSFQSAAFSIDRGSSSNPFKRIFEGNVVEQVKQVPIQYANQGRLTLLDNVFTRSKSAAGNTINYGGWYQGIYQLLSINNYFEDSIYVAIRKDHPFILYSVKDQPFYKKQPRSFKVFTDAPFLPLINRIVFDVKEGSGAAEIQGFINKAARLKGKRPIIHFETAVYNLDKCLVVPDGSDIQFVGDGLLWSTDIRRKEASSSDPLFTVEGNSHCVFRDLMIHNGTNASAEAILFIGSFKPQSEIHIDQIYTNAPKSLVAENINYAHFQKDNSFYSSGTTLIGGQMMKNGKGSFELDCFGGQSAGASLQNAVMVTKDCWWEGASKKVFRPIDLSGSGRFTLDGAMIASADHDSVAAIRVRNFKGQVTLSDMYVYGGIQASGNKDLELLIWNVHFLQKENPFNFIHSGDQYQVGMAGISKQCSKSQSASCVNEGMLSPSDVFKNVSDTLRYFKDMTTDLRAAKPRSFRSLPDPVTNVLISRVAVYGGGIAFHFKEN